MLATSILSGYRINGSAGYLEVVNDSYESIVKKKQRAVLFDRLLYAKSNKSGHPFRERVVDIESGYVYRNERVGEIDQSKLEVHKPLLNEQYQNDIW